MSVVRSVVWLLALAACVFSGFLYGVWLRPEGAPQRPARIGFIAASPDDFYQSAIAGARDAADEVGAVLEVMVPSSSKEQSTLIAGINKATLDGVAVSLLSPLTQTRMLSMLANEVPVVTYDNDAPMSLRNCYIGTDNYSGGQLSAKIVQEILPEGGKVALFIGDIERNNALDRRLGFLDELLGRSRDAKGRIDPADQSLEGNGYTVVETLLDDHDEATCRENVEKALAAHEDLAVLVGLYGYNAPVCASVVEQRGLEDQVKIVGFDEHQGTLDGIESGLIAGTVVQDPYKYGYETVRLLASWRDDRFSEPAKGGLAPVLIPCRKVGPDNLSDFRAQLGRSKSTSGDAAKEAEKAAPTG